jgi:hypothetical protein
MLLARSVLEGTHLFQTGTRTDVVRMLRDELAQDFDCGWVVVDQHIPVARIPCACTDAGRLLVSK